MTVSCLPFTHDVLEVYRTFAKRQIYRIKAMEYYEMQSLAKKASELTLLTNDDGKANIDLKGVRKLMWELYTVIKYVNNSLYREHINHPNFDKTAIDPYQDDEISHSRICDICKCDIFNRCFHCDQCAVTDHGIDFCLGCVAQLRHCQHVDKMQLQQCMPLEECVEKLFAAVKVYEDVRLRLQTLLYTEMKDIQDSGQRPKKWMPPPAESFTMSHEERDKYERSVGTIAFEFVMGKKATVSAAAAAMTNAKDTQQEAEWCHQCRTLHTSCDIIQCSETQQYYCKYCLWNRYSLTWFDCRRHLRWRSPLAQGVCNCEVCLPQRNIDVSGYAYSVLSKLKDLNSVQPFMETAIVPPDERIILDPAADFDPKVFSVRTEQIIRHQLDHVNQATAGKTSKVQAFRPHPPEGIKKMELEKLNKPKQTLLVISRPEATHATNEGSFKRQRTNQSDFNGMEK